MAAKHLRIYMNNPTAGGVDGTEISSGDDTLPLSITLDASKAESKAAKCAVRCDSGYLIDGDTDIYAEGTNAAKWQFAPDNNYADADIALNMGVWSSTLTISDVAATNKVFWVKAMSATTEDPQNDRSVKIYAEGLVVAAAG